jgi:tetratricopeptide (TPR) repeat protein
MTASFLNTSVIHSQSPQPQELINKETLTGTLASKADARLYQIHIGANEFVLIRALQKEIDVDLALLDATGRVLANMDTEVDTDRAEYLGWIAADAGDFTVRLTPGRENETYGRYEVQVIERRLPTDEDQNRMKAQAVVMEAQASLQEIKTQPREAGRLIRGAIAKYQQSIPMWQAAKDKNAMARCLIIVGENSLRLGDRPAARDSFEKALVLRRASPVDRWGEAEALNNLAVVHDEMGEKQEAIELHKLVRPIRRETGNLKGEITTLLNVSKSYVELDEITLAQAALEETRVVLDEFKKKTNGVGDQQGESEYSSRYGLIYDRLGASDLAISWFERALTIIRSIPDYSHDPLYVESEATYLNNLGKAYSGKGDKNKARDYYQQALKRCGDDCTSNKRADFLHNLASASIALGDLQTARSSFDDVLKFRGNDSFYEAYTRIGLGNLIYETMVLPAARKEFDRALFLSL